MSDPHLPHLDADLDRLSRHADTTGRLGSPARLRRVAERRRARRRAAAGTAAVAGAALGVAAIFSVQALVAGGRPGGPSAASQPPATSATPPSSGSSDPSSAPLAKPASGTAVLAGDRQVVLLPAGTSTVLGLSGTTSDIGQRLRVATAIDERTLLVPTPVSPGARDYLLKLGGVGVGAEPLCLGAGADGRVASVPCDAADDSAVWRLTSAGTSTTAPSYDLSTRSGRYVTAAGTTVTTSTVPSDATSLWVADRGPARINSLD